MVRAIISQPRGHRDPGLHVSAPRAPRSWSPRLCPESTVILVTTSLPRGHCDPDHHVSAPRVRRAVPSVTERGRLQRPVGSKLSELKHTLIHQSWHTLNSSITSCCAPIRVPHLLMRLTSETSITSSMGFVTGTNASYIVSTECLIISICLLGYIQQ